jgi:hypothetical protein
VADYTFKRGDLGRPIIRQLYEVVEGQVPEVDPSSGVITLQKTFVLQIINLSTANQVKLLLKQQGASSTGGGVATISDAANGEVTYLTQAADTNTVRSWDGECEITWNNGRIQTVPDASQPGDSAQYFTVDIVGDLG